MIKELKSDLRRYQIIGNRTRRSFIRRIEKILFQYGLHAVIVYRYGQWVRNMKLPSVAYPLRTILILPYRMMSWFIKKAYDISLDINAEIGAGFYIGHFGGIIVGPCTIGRNCSIQQHVKIVIDNENARIPEIGSNVWIGSHSTIVGSKIGDHATISTGTYLKKDLLEKSLAAGNPGRVLVKEYDNSEILGILV